jgi:FHA domain-containing protein
VARALGLDTSDSGLLAIGDDGAVFGPSPGIALVEAQRALFGAEALHACRLRPRLVASDFWARLDDEPLGPPFPEGVRAVDLVHGHLESLWREAKPHTSEVVLAVPGTCDERQLGRLVGIAEALGLPVSGAVDAAVAAASAGFTGERLLHVDLGQRRAVVTQIRQGPLLVRERVAPIERWGRDEVLDAQMRGAAAAFVKQARFDPLHDAATEQALFDRLPDWIAALERADGVAAVLPAAGRDVETSLMRGQVEAWTARFADELQQQVSLLKHTGEPTGVLVSAHAARLPGLVARLAAVRGVEVAILPVQAAALGALRARDAVRSQPGALRFVTRLPRPEAPEASSLGAAVLLPPARRPAAASGGRRPTHVLLDTAAHAIGTEPLVVGTAPPSGARGLRLEGETAGVSRAHCRFFESAGESVVEDLSSWGTFVNGERVAGRAVLAAGDKVRVGSPGIELVLIAAGEG